MYYIYSAGQYYYCDITFLTVFLCFTNSVQLKLFRKMYLVLCHHILTATEKSLGSGTERFYSTSTQPLELNCKISKKLNCMLWIHVRNKGKDKAVTRACGHIDMVHTKHPGIHPKARRGNDVYISPLQIRSNKTKIREKDNRKS